MSEKQAGIQRRGSRAEVDRLVSEYEASGLARQEFCAKHGLSLATLDRYRNRWRQRTEAPSGSNRFLRVERSNGYAPIARGCAAVDISGSTDVVLNGLRPFLVTVRPPRLLSIRETRQTVKVTSGHLSPAFTPE